MRRRTALRLGAASVAGLVEWTVGCSGDGSSGSGTSGGAGAGPADDLSDVIYEGGATDEALRALLAEPLVASPTEGATLVEPATGGSVSVSTPPRLVWAVGVKTAKAAEPPASDGRRRALSRFPRFGPRAALAHGTPISGRAYFVVFATPKEARLIRVFTTALEYTPTSEVWSRVAALKSVSVTITNAIFDVNRVAPDGGPFRGPASSVVLAG